MVRGGSVSNTIPRSVESAMNAMPKTELEDHEFCVRFDIESVDITS